MDNIRLCTYNCNSFRNNLNVVKSLLESHDIVLLQELMLLQEDVFMVNDVSDEFESFVFVRDKACEGILEGRPTKGVCILWRKVLTKYVTPVYHNECFIGMMINVLNVKILLLNVYLPFYNKNNESIADFINSLSIIESIIKDSSSNSVIIMGDFNSNLDDSHFGKILADFILKNKFRIPDKALPDDSFTFLSPAHNTTSFLDHILCSENLFDCISDISISYESCLFDHFPLSCILKVETEFYHEEFSYNNPGFVLWNKMTNREVDIYKDKIDQLCLRSESFKHESLMCNVYNCKSESHINNLDKVYSSMIDILQTASSDFTIYINRDKKKCIPGWNDYVKPFYEEAKKRFFIWKNGGREREGVKLKEMKSSRSLFKRALEFCKKNETSIRNEKLISSYKNKNMKGFWNQVNMDRSNEKKSYFTTRIENETNEDKIVELFSENYKNILDDKKCQSDKNFNVRNVKWFDAFNMFNVSELKNIINDMKPTLGLNFIHLYHVKYGSYLLMKTIVKFFNSCLMHNYLPKKMLFGEITPIIKNKFGKLNDISNYRPIMISSVFLKMFEYAILNRIRYRLNFNDRQHGFRTGYSTTTAGLVLKETIFSYLNGGSSMHAAFLDISKAFDKVNHSVLFDKLDRLNIPHALLNIVVYIYNNQFACVKFKNSISSNWMIKNGVRQGGILSPVFFCIYIDELINKVASCGVGAKYGILASNIIAYADDIVLLSPSVEGLRHLLQLIEFEAREISLQFNSNKSVVINFSKRNVNFGNDPKFVLSNNTLKNVNEVMYLGFVINKYLDESNDIKRLRNNFFNKFNLLLRKFNSVDSSVLLYLFRSICIQFYGADIWINYESCSQVIKQFKIGYHKAIKKICNTSYTMSNHLICNEVGLFTFDHYINYLGLCTMFRLLFRPCKFIEKCKLSFLRGYYVKNFKHKFYLVYGIEDIFENDLDGLKSRIWFIQNLEDTLR